MRQPAQRARPSCWLQDRQGVVLFVAALADEHLGQFGPSPPVSLGRIV